MCRVINTLEASDAIGQRATFTPDTSTGASLPS
jgi:hypothetical protein